MQVVVIVMSMFVLCYFAVLVVLEVLLEILYKLLTHLHRRANRELPAKHASHLLSRSGLQPLQMAVLAATILHDQLWPAQPMLFHGLAAAYVITSADFQWPLLKSVWKRLLWTSKV